MANWDIPSNKFFKICISDLANDIINLVYDTNGYVELLKKIVVCNVILGMPYLIFLNKSELGSRNCHLSYYQEVIILTVLF
jgi:spore cortex formation protein SpoVR/YcgB (stage V sporulation)